MATINYQNAAEIPDSFRQHVIETERGYELDATLVLENAVADAKRPFEHDRELLVEIAAELEITNAILDAGGFPKLLLPALKRSIRPEYQGGRVVVTVVVKNGEPRLSKSGEPLEIADLISEMKGDPRIGRVAFEQPRTGYQPQVRREAAKYYEPPNNTIRLTRQQARDPKAYQAALAQVGGDHRRVVIDKE